MKALALIFAALLALPAAAQTLGGSPALSPPVGGASGGIVGAETTFNAPVNCGTETITFAATMNVDASTKPCKSIAATGNFTLTTSNLAPTRVVTVTITADSTDRTMTFPAGWTWVGTTVPGTILASSTSVIQITSGTSADSGVTAKYWTKDGNPLLGKQLRLSSTTPLSIGSNAGLTSDFAGGAFVLDNDAFFTTAQLNVHSNDANPAFLFFSKTRGTHAAPAALHSSDGLGSIYWSGFGTGYTFGADIRPFATETWDGTHHGTAMFLETNKNADAGVNTWVLGPDGSTTLPGTLVVPSTITANGQFALGITALTPAASVAIDFAATASPTKSLAVSQATTFTTSNLSAGVTDTVYLTTDASARTPTWPAAWKWVGSGAPTSLAASTTSVLTLTSTTTADSGVLASLSPQNATVNLSTDVSGGPLSVALGGSGNTTNAGVLISVVKATSGTSITSPAGTHSADVTVCGGGGGGGGTTTAAASAAVGGGGASGSSTRKFYTGLSPLTAYTTSFGAAGTAGSSSGGNGGTGGDATFTDGTTLITGKGGLGGLGESAGNVAGYSDGGAVVSGTNGDWFGGQPGTYGARSTGLIGIGGSGGSSPFGAGGAGSSTAGAGAAATGNCAGGAGGVVLNNSAAVTGGAGSAPLLVVRWYQ